MEATELRINNIVNRRFLNPSPKGIETCFTNCKIKAIGIEKLIYECKDKSLNKVDFDVIYPILLTEQWFLDFGYKKVHGSFYAKGHLIWFCNDLFMCDKNGIILKHVHQLQNLYFALTQTELILKP